MQTCRIKQNKAKQLRHRTATRELFPAACSLSFSLLLKIQTREGAFGLGVHASSSDFPHAASTSVLCRAVAPGFTFLSHFSFLIFSLCFAEISQHPRSANTVVSAVTVLPAHREMIFTETAAAAQSVPDVRLFSLCSPAFLRWPHGRFLPAVRKRPWPRWVVASVAYGRSSRSPPSRLRQRHPWG